MVVHIPSNQPTQPSQPVKSQRETDLENYAVQLQEQNQKLLDRNYFNNLSDDKFFRVELLNSINSIAQAMTNFLAKLEAQAQEQPAN
jgi:hypothetical protein